MYAHSLSDRPPAEWELLADHLNAVSRRAAEFASAFGWSEAARVAGLLHDIGKTSGAFQAYIAAITPGVLKGPDHSTAGAREAVRLFPKPMGRMLAYAIAGHHAGLADARNLDDRLDPAIRPIEPFGGWEAHTGPLPPASALAPKRPFQPSPHKGFSEAFLTRMLFACLVDADFLETEKFYARAEGRPIERGGHLSMEVLRERLQAYMAAKRRNDTPVNLLRGRVLDHAVEKAALEPGLFTLTVPTGGGKTLASLSFALEHAVRHGLRRVVFVIPFTSVVDQSADVFREALGTQKDVLEHHASFDWDAPRSVETADDEGTGGLRKLQRAAENWDVPVVVTTAVQFYESLFAARTARCRKLHNLAGSVIVLDEAQTLPVGLLKPCLAALDELARNYGATVVVCTATQPAWRASDAALIDKRGKNFGLEIPPDRELAPDPEGLYAELKRVSVEVRGETTDAEVAARFAEQDQMLCIVNSRAHARALYETIGDLPGATHLSTLMCPAHRRQVLADVKARLAAGSPVRLVSTSLIEAGVDVDFPEVWRSEAGSDSIAQSAGRANREGLLEQGRVVVFTPADARSPQAFRVFQQAAREVLRQGHADLLGLEAMRSYFRELYWQKGDGALDSTLVNGRPGVLDALSHRADGWAFPFRSLAEAFRLIDDVMEPVIVPWNDEAEALRNAVAEAERPLPAHLRKLQQYVVAIPRAARDEWWARGVLTPAHPALGEGLLTFADNARYHPEFGLDLKEIGWRASEKNCIS